MPILDSNSLEFFSRSPEQTRRLGMRLGSLMSVGDVIALSGDLGSGKTTLIQGIAQGWGSLDPVSSPTFVLVNQYRRPDGLILFHLDTYRLSGSAEALDLDLDWMMDSGALVIEWADRIREVLPAQALWIQMRWVADEQRGMVLTAGGERYARMLSEFKRQVFGGV